MICPHCGFSGEFESIEKRKGNRFSFTAFSAFAIGASYGAFVYRDAPTIIMLGLAIYVLTILMQKEIVYRCENCQSHFKENEDTSQ